MCVCVFVHNNRCIDYSKASHGISLVPRPETFAFKEAFDLPLNCIRDNHTHATITLKIQSVSICPFIISDRQWIQENILCLVSNSVKYSGQPSCEVLITVRLSSMDGLPSSPWIDRQVGCCVCVFVFVALCVCVCVCVCVCACVCARQLNTNHFVCNETDKWRQLGQQQSRAALQLQLRRRPGWCRRRQDAVDGIDGSGQTDTQQQPHQHQQLVQHQCRRRKWRRRH
jgi:hypothetical protein